jgi:hypothetical protein
VIHATPLASVNELVLPGNINSYVNSPIYARTNGYLMKWYKDIGAHVKQGDLLADIDTPEIDQQLAQGATPGSTENKPATTVTIEVDPSQAERVEVANRLGRLSLVVRSASNEPVAAADAAPPTITWASDVSPALGSETTAAGGSVVHVYSGAGDGKEYRF